MRHVVAVRLGRGAHGVHQCREAVGQQFLGPALHRLAEEDVVHPDHGREENREADRQCRERAGGQGLRDEAPHADHSTGLESR